jgi:hypothetical protein
MTARTAVHLCHLRHLRLGVAAVWLTASAAAARPFDSTQGTEPRLVNGTLERHAATASLARDIQTLASRMTDPGWIAYRVPVVEGEHTMCDWTNGTRSMVSPAPVHLEPLMVFFVFYRVEQRQIVRIRSYSVDCPLDAGGKAVQWHGATPENVKALQAAGIRGVSVDDLVRLRIHKVTPDFIRAFESRGYKGLVADDYVRMRIHKVTPEEMDQLKALGFGGLGVDELVRFRIHKVTPDYIRSMQAVGFVTMFEAQLVRMRIHKVDAQFVRDARADGYAIQAPGDAIDLAIHGPRWRRRRQARPGPSSRRPRAVSRKP